MENISIGLLLIAISALGYFSNWLNWRFLNYKWNEWLYFLGAFVHESSHAIFCLLSGAKIAEFKIFVRQPRVSYLKPKLPILGNLFISIAPALIGLLAVYLADKFLLKNYFTIPHLKNITSFPQAFFSFLKQINFSDWKNLLALFFSLNLGAMLAPSRQDLKNIWWLIIILFFFSSPGFTGLGILVIFLILLSILAQSALLILRFLLKIIF